MEKFGFVFYITDAKPLSTKKRLPNKKFIALTQLKLIFSGHFCNLITQIYEIMRNNFKKLSREQN